MSSIRLQYCRKKVFPYKFWMDRSKRYFQHCQQLSISKSFLIVILAPFTPFLWNSFICTEEILPTLPSQILGEYFQCSFSATEKFSHWKTFHNYLSSWKLLYLHNNNLWIYEFHICRQLSNNVGNWLLWLYLLHWLLCLEIIYFIALLIKTTNWAKLVCT